MASAIEIFFDPFSERTIRNIWQDLENIGVSSLATRTHRRHRPHIALAVMDTDPADEEFLSELREVLTVETFEIMLSAVAFFPSTSVLMLSVSPTIKLISLQQKVHETLNTWNIDNWRYYVPGNWHPHCTLAQHLDKNRIPTELLSIINMLPIKTTATACGLVNTNTGLVVSEIQFEVN